MTKTSKKRAKQVRSTPDGDDQLIKRARTSLSKGMTALDTCVDNLAASIAGMDPDDEESYDSKAASHLAWLMKNMAQVMSEIRKIETDEKKNQPMTAAVVLAWFKKQDKAERIKLVEELAAIDKQRNVFG